MTRADRGGRGPARPIGAMTLLELLSGSAGTGVVAANLRSVAMDGLDLRVLASGSRGAVGIVHVGRAAGRKRNRRSALRLRFGAGFADDRLQAEQKLHDLILDAF